MKKKLRFLILMLLVSTVFVSTGATAQYRKGFISGYEINGGVFVGKRDFKASFSSNIMAGYAFGGKCYVGIQANGMFNSLKRDSKLWTGSTSLGANFGYALSDKWELYCGVGSTMDSGRYHFMYANFGIREYWYISNKFQSYWTIKVQYFNPYQSGYTNSAAILLGIGFQFANR